MAPIGDGHILKATYDFVVGTQVSALCLDDESLDFEMFYFLMVGFHTLTGKVPPLHKKVTRVFKNVAGL
jgi:hypothetical protein